MTKQDTAQRPQETEHKPVIPTTQLIATALAAVTAAFLGSFIGTAGTVIGAGLASVITSVASGLYQRSLDRTRSKVRSTVSQVRQQRDTSRTPHPSADSSPAEALADAPTVRLGPVPPKRRVRWPLVAGVTAAMFLVGIGAVTGVELLHGSPLSGGNTGTSVGHLFGQPTDRDPAPTTEPTQPSTQPHTSTATTTTPSAPATTTPQPNVGATPTTQAPTTTAPPTTTSPPAPTTTTGTP
jgi:hypothetical protein